ncbi:ergothioneine biosynthesis protein EgtC [Amycolatopsis pithecellobii]|uniref:Gamma-glutamyl-hercynylcysteine sulfoxide hydrolase n=1 Tax=Amycolatopsis pithecellobii TaxID=664692 RepID=A0A6N7Z420_9PSEU|nr:ergothioneine biosynthesis protein EgtC [Amycolatopsis pithecellobii]MTD56783.1 ergothioneine biosynthesis protein EgtC [Amycolatopsis pithecellobii]
MCRHLAYLGPPESPAGLVFGAPHSLRHQSYAPADMRGGGTVNADGFGIAWYTGETPVRYRRASPIWTDHDAPVLTESVRTGAFVAAVRNGTPGMPVSEASVAPFVDGRWSFSHNGMVTGWPGSLAALAGKLPVTDLLTLEAPTDSAVLWALLAERLRAGEDPVRATAELTAKVEAAAPGSRLNFLLTDGTILVATAWTHSLSVRESGGAVVVASEPTGTEPGWVPVPDGHAVVARAGSTEIIPLDADRSALT